jgi:hypothetical protein
MYHFQQSALICLLLVFPFALPSIIFRFLKSSLHYMAHPVLSGGAAWSCSHYVSSATSWSYPCLVPSRICSNTGAIISAKRVVALDALHLPNSSSCCCSTISSNARFACPRPPSLRFTRYGQSSRSLLVVFKVPSGRL